MKTIKILTVTSLAAIAMITFTACTDNTITDEDLARGWYTAQEDEKKDDTPENWVWIEDGENSKWIDSVTEMMDH